MHQNASILGNDSRPVEKGIKKRSVIPSSQYNDGRTMRFNAMRSILINSYHLQLPLLITPATLSLVFGVQLILPLSRAAWPAERLATCLPSPIVVRRPFF
jgi:hypothetical protein